MCYPLRRYVAEVIEDNTKGPAKFLKVEIRTHSWQDAFDEAKYTWKEKLVSVRAAQPWEIFLVPELGENND